MRINNTLKILSLTNNEVGDRGVKALAAALRINNTLMKLFLACNNIGDEGAISIRDALLTNGSLKYLDLDKNFRISEQTRNDITSTIRADIIFVL